MQKKEKKKTIVLTWQQNETDTTHSKSHLTHGPKSS